MAWADIVVQDIGLGEFGEKIEELLDVHVTETMFGCQNT